MTREDLIKLKQDNRNNKVIYNLLSTVIGEYDLEVTRPKGNADINTILKKFLKNNQETLEQSKDKLSLTIELGQENTFIESILPKQLSEEEITLIVKDFTDKGINNIGIIMNYFKNTYAGLYNGSIVSKIAKELINN